MEHWRDIEESEYLAHWDLMVDQVTLTITECKNEVAKLREKKVKVIAYFLESELPEGIKTKPMILNNENKHKIIEETGLRHQKDWKNIKVTIGIGKNSGGKGYAKGLRILKAENLNKFDINEILTLSDHKKAKELAAKFGNMMNQEQVEEVKKHLEKIK